MMVPVFVGMGLAYMLGWDALVHHSHSWAVGGDLWGIFRGAHYVGWGYLGGIYTNGNGIVTFPGICVILAPVAMLTEKLNLSESFSPFFLARPTAALVLVPVELLLASSVMFAADALAERLHVLKSRRALLCVVVAIIAWPVVALWGHAEDVLAMTFAVYAMIAMLNRRWAAFGWLLGFGIVMQPLVALMLPLFIAATPRGQRVLVTIRSMALSAVLVGVAFAGDPADTYQALVKQPTPPSLNHPTPWVAFAPKIFSRAAKTYRGVNVLHGSGHASLRATTVHSPAYALVSGGPGRMIDVVLAVLVGLYVWRRPQPPDRLLWLAALVLASRCFFEPVMTPYYLAPPLILAMVMTARQGGRRFWASIVLALEITVYAYYDLNEWIWWLPIVGGLAVVVALGYPIGSGRALDPPEMSIDKLERPEWDDGAIIGAVAERTLEPA